MSELIKTFGGAAKAAAVTFAIIVLTIGVIKADTIKKQLDNFLANCFNEMAQEVGLDD